MLPLLSSLRDTECVLLDASADENCDSRLVDTLATDLSLSVPAWHHVHEHCFEIIVPIACINMLQRADDSDLSERSFISANGMQGALEMMNSLMPRIATYAGSARGSSDGSYPQTPASPNSPAVVQLATPNAVPPRQRRLQSTRSSPTEHHGQVRLKR